MNLHVAMVLLLLTAIVQQMEAAGTNCGVGKECSKCPNKKFLFFRINGKFSYAVVCCKSCDKHFRASVNRGSKNGNDKPWCTCDYDRMGGTCWKGDKCSRCDSKYVGRVNSLPVCCANCEKKGLRLSVTNCDCNK